MDVLSAPCTDTKVGNALKSLDYAFSHSPLERQAIYEAHLRECNYCSNQRARHLKKTRMIGLGFTFGGLALAIISIFIIWFQYTQTTSSFITIPHGLFIVGISLFGKGLWQLIRGKTSDQR